MALPELSEDTVDDLLYFARTADLEELQNTLTEAAKRSTATLRDILFAAKDVESGNTTLHMAAANGHAETIKSLLTLTSADKTPDSTVLKAPVAFIDIPNNNGNTPLHWAALNGHLEAVKVLVDGGADLLVKNNAGHDVAYEAELAGKEDVVNWLLGAENYDDKQEEEESEEAGPIEAGFAEAEGSPVDTKEKMAE